MLALIGLGNPGAEYAETRHNLGFMVVDALAELPGERLHAKTGLYASAQRSYEGQDILLVKPLTYMNNSGLAVAAVQRTYGMGINSLLIVVDDFHLPLGTLRMRHRGSDGGHNGLRSIIQHLGTSDFARMRCGIGGASMPDEKSEMASYVLSPFDTAELRNVRQLIEEARDAALAVALIGRETAMQRFNTKKI